MQAKTTLLGGALLAGLLLSGCHKEPKGQIVAIVNGDEISMQELNAEVAGISIPDNANRAKMRRDVLQRLIDRKLIVQKAREQGLDKTPEFIAQERKLDENLLVSILGQKIAQTVPMPDDRDVNQYIVDHPTQFAQREQLLLDQIQFQSPSDVKKLIALKDAHNLDDIAAGLKTLNLAYSRGKGVIDTARLDPDLMKKINALPPGEPFVLPSNGQFVASVIVARQPVATPPAVAKQTASEIVRRRALVAESHMQVSRARTAAEIKYQPGYEPTKAPAAPAATPAAPPPPPAKN